MKQHGHNPPMWRIHRAIGMGGDQMIGALLGDDVEEREGDDIRATEKERYFELIDEVQPLEGARELVEDLKRSGHRVVLASSAKPDEVDHYLDLLDARELADAWTTSGDVENTKPEPDLVNSALDKIGGGPAVMVGDSVFDCEAARNAGIDTIAVLTGGFSDSELIKAGAVIVFASIVELRERLSWTPLG
jgi:HAD superfamily hydrolase (TIGR01549 family)